MRVGLVCTHFRHKYSQYLAFLMLHKVFSQLGCRILARQCCRSDIFSISSLCAQSITTHSCARVLLSTRTMATVEEKPAEIGEEKKLVEADSAAPENGSSPKQEVDSEVPSSVVDLKISPETGMSKRAKKRMLRFQLLKERKRNEPKPLTRNQDPGFSAELFQETEFYFENGLRKVYPYYFTFKTYAKQRWIGQKLIDVFTKEFRSEEPETYEKAVTEGKLTVHGRKVSPDYKLRHNDLLANTTHRHENPVTGTPIEVIADTEDVVVINKPSSIPCHPCGRYRHNSIPFILGKELGYSNLRNIYRLDRLTSGVLICAKTPEKTRELEDQISNKQVCKEYVCRVVGRFPDGEVVCEQPLAPFCHKISLWQVNPKGRQSKTTFQRLSYNGRTSVVKCLPYTGRTHQIRVHLQYLGHPIVNDPFYNSEAFGPNRGKGGNYERPEEEIFEEILKTHNTGMWLEGQNPLFHQRLQEIRAASAGADGNQEEAKDCGKTGSTDPEVLNVAPSVADQVMDCTIPNSETDSNNANVSGDNDSEILHEPASKRLRTDQSCLPTSTKVNESSFNVAKWVPDENCEYCRNKYIDPKPEDLVMYLHAVRYKGPDWEYSTPLPDWAKDDWIDNTR